MHRHVAFLVLATLISGLNACSSATGPATTPATALVSVTPPGGATSVSPSGPIVVAFSHGMYTGMEMDVSLHEGDVTGPTVACTTTWSTGRDTLTIMPATPLKAATQYTLHVGGGMKDANGDIIDMTQHGAMMGGQWATSSMMAGAGMMGGGGPMSGQEMGPGWAGTNRMYGMIFSFTTS